MAVVATLVAACMPPSWGARALLHPTRRAVVISPAQSHRDFEVESNGATLRGWVFPAGPPRGSVAIVYLHGVADNRASGVWIAERLVPAGYAVVAYDSRAHGGSTGDTCTYGFYEKRDLSRVLDELGIARAVIVGVSLGAAVALQSAPEDPRIMAVVAAATFADLETIARERAPWFASEDQVREALAIAEHEGHFEVAAVSPVKAAARIRTAVLLVHGSEDHETRPEHSERVFAALAGPKLLRLVPGAGHDDALALAWGAIETWIRETAPAINR